MPELILASQSKHRAKLLQGLGYAFTTQPADVDETPLPKEAPLAYVKRVATAKALAVAKANPGKVVLAADTVALCGRTILQKPADLADARCMMEAQSGRRVHIPSVLVVVNAEGKYRTESVKSWLKIKRLGPQDIDRWLADPTHWQHVAGAMQVENPLFESFIQTFYGSHSGVIGLPLYETAKLLAWAEVNPA